VKRMVRIAVSVAIGVACWTGGSRDAAEAAIADAEDTITDVHARAIRYAPEEFKAVMDEYSAAREALEGEDFRGAVRSAHRAIELAKEVSRTATVQRNALEADWPTLRDSVTSLLSAIGERVAELSGAEALPAGITSEQLASARASMGEIRRGLEQASEAFDGGDLHDAVHAATVLKSRTDEVMESLGMKPRANALE
jgi:hypothetical protein